MNTYSDKVNAEEIVIFCDEHGQPTGEVGPKLDSHNADTQMHLAFSLYVFNDEGKFLVTQRAHTKKVWRGVWTNSCCGHLAQGETTIDAARRRLKEELGMEAKDFTVVIPDYTYKTPPYEGVIEHEFCPVVVARAVASPAPNEDEIADYKWVDWEWYAQQLANDAADAPKWSWWCRDQAKLLEQNAAFKDFRSL